MDSVWWVDSMRYIVKLDDGVCMHACVLYFLVLARLPPLPWARQSNRVLATKERAVGLHEPPPAPSPPAQNASSTYDITRMWPDTYDYLDMTV